MALHRRRRRDDTLDTPPRFLDAPLVLGVELLEVAEAAAVARIAVPFRAGLNRHRIIEEQGEEKSGPTAHVHPFTPAWNATRTTRIARTQPLRRRGRWPPISLGISLAHE